MRLLTHALDAIASRLDWYWTGHVDWMAFNFFLAVLPVLLAVPLFRRGVRRSPLWFAGFGFFLLLLPYTPYVLTDIIHFDEAVDSAYSPLRGFVEFAPLYALYLIGAFGMYVWAVRRSAPTLVELTPAWLTTRRATWGLHAVAVLGIFVGRITRLHAWHPFTDPAFTVERLLSMASPLLLLMVPATLVLGASTWVALEACDRVAATARRFTRSVADALTFGALLPDDIAYVRASEHRPETRSPAPRPDQ